MQGMQWRARETASLDIFREGDWLRTPGYKFPIYNKQVLPQYEARQLGSQLWNQRDGTKHMVQYDNEEDGVYDPAARDTLDLRREPLAPEVQLVTSKLWAEALEGLQYISPGHEGQPTTDTVPQILGYGPGGHFITHSDSHSWNWNHDRWDEGHPRRMLSGVLFLSEGDGEDFAGGELEFPNLLNSLGEPCVIRPAAGLFLLFPSHPLYAHRVQKVAWGHRVAITAFWDLV